MSTAVPSTIPAVVPLFPLPQHVLLPASPTPYRIFEPGHRRMVMDLLERPSEERWLVVPRLLAGGAPAGATAPFHPVAALGLMTLATPLADGDFLIVVEGDRICQVEEVDAPFAPYRVGRPLVLRDQPEADPAGKPSTLDLVQGMFALLEVLGPAAGELPVAYGGEPDDALIVYRIAAAVLDDPDSRQRILDERGPARRRELVHAALVELLDVASRRARDDTTSPEVPR